MATCRLPALADACLRALLKECNGVFLADLPLELLLSSHVWDQDGLVPGARLPTPCCKRTGKRGGLCVRYDLWAECRLHIPYFMGDI